jgi:hypothetical protein
MADLDDAINDAMRAIVDHQAKAREAVWASPSRSQVRATIQAQFDRAEAAEAKLARWERNRAAILDALAIAAGALPDDDGVPGRYEAVLEDLDSEQEPSEPPK